MKRKLLTAVVMSLFVATAFAQSSTGTGQGGTSGATNRGTDANQGPGSGSAPAATMPSTSSASSSFEALDKNGDGYISKSEAKQDRVLSRQWKKLDSDKDGKLSRAEYDASAAGAGSNGTSGSGMSTK